MDDSNWTIAEEESLRCNSLKPIEPLQTDIDHVSGVCSFQMILSEACNHDDSFKAVEKVWRDFAHSFLFGLACAQLASCIVSIVIFVFPLDTAVYVCWYRPAVNPIECVMRFERDSIFRCDFACHAIE